MLKQKLENYNIILASNSPRRKMFLKEMNIPFTVKKKEVEEKYPDELKGSEITVYLSKLKAEVLKYELNEHDILITSDTIVWSENKALEKASVSREAFLMIRSLSGKLHEVITSVSFTTLHFQKTVTATTRVRFKELTDEEIHFYIENYKPFDKAGAYGIQEWIGLIGIDYIEGSYFNVVGLPTHLVYETLMEIVSETKN
ncbi:MAG: Maf family nucleotide pyrophosphatase [Gillisia sp.]